MEGASPSEVQSFRNALADRLLSLPTEGQVEGDAKSIQALRQLMLGTLSDKVRQPMTETAQAQYGQVRSDWRAACMQFIDLAGKAGQPQ